MPKALTGCHHLLLDTSNELNANESYCQCTEYAPSILDLTAARASAQHVIGKVFTIEIHRMVGPANQAFSPVHGLLEFPIVAIEPLDGGDLRNTTEEFAPRCEDDALPNLVLIKPPISGVHSMVLDYAEEAFWDDNPVAGV